jgi:hypothetical protein
LQKSAIDITFGAVFTAAVFSVRFPIVFVCVKCYESYEGAFKGL